MTAQATISPKPPVDISRYADYLEQRRLATQASIGAALEKARRRIGLSLETAAAELRLTERNLDHYEAGIRTPSPGMLLEMADLYGTKVEAFGRRDPAPRLPPHIDYESETLWIGWTPISLSAGSADNAHVIRSLAAAIRSMRSLSESKPVYLREAEIPLIASLLDLDDVDLPTVLMKFLGLTYIESEDLVQAMRADDLETTRAS